MQGVGVIERAFQIAPECGSVAEVRRRLLREGYINVDAHTGGRQIRQEIKVRLDPQLRVVEGRPAAR
jgi:hypothetical protein